MKRNRIVPDASVVLKWVLRTDDERDTEAALGLLNRAAAGEIEFMLPKLWLFEVGNVVGRKVPEKAPEIIEILGTYRFREVDLSPHVARLSFGLMRDYVVSFYDASYHAVALAEGGTFVTADEAYCRKVSGAGSVILLRDL